MGGVRRDCGILRLVRYHGYYYVTGSCNGRGLTRLWKIQIGTLPWLLVKSGSGDGRGLTRLWNTQIGTLPWLLVCEGEWRWAGSDEIVEYSDWNITMVTSM